MNAEKLKALPFSELVYMAEYASSAAQKADEKYHAYDGQDDWDSLYQSRHKAFEVSATFQNEIDRRFKELTEGEA